MIQPPHGTYAGRLEVTWFRTTVSSWHRPRSRGKLRGRACPRTTDARLRSPASANCLRSPHEMQEGRVVIPFRR